MGNREGGSRLYPIFDQYQIHIRQPCLDQSPTIFLFFDLRTMAARSLAAAFPFRKGFADVSSPARCSLTCNVRLYLCARVSYLQHASKESSVLLRLARSSGQSDAPE